jgi:hypothetical protein
LAFDPSDWIGDLRRRQLFIGLFFLGSLNAGIPDPGPPGRSSHQIF